MYQLARPKTIRRGVTLIELLVVVTIVVTLAAIAIPSMRFLSEGRRIREAAREVNVYLGNARNRAAETGRPVGVMFERRERHPHASVLLRQVEVPPAFTGNTLDAVVQPLGPPVLYVSPSGVRRWFLTLRIPVVQFPNRLIRRGDLMRLNYQGPWYMVSDIPGDNTPPHQPNPPADSGSDFPVDMTVDPDQQYIDFKAGTDTDVDGWYDTHWLSLEIDRALCEELNQGGQPIPWGITSTRKVSFEILRQPIPSSVAPLQLSRGAVVDLAASGFDSLLPDWNTQQVAHNFEPDVNPRPVIVMFSPSGAVDRVYYTMREYDYASSPPVFDRCTYLGRQVVEPIYFLVGKWERLALSPRPINVPSPPPMPPALAEDGIYNRQDTSNLWLMLNPQTGLVTVAQLNGDTFDPGSGMEIPSGATFSEQLSVARRLVREAQISLGGR